jgi:hypothetical protein
MNEHIKRLARQAGFDVELMERNHANGNPSMAHELAELIVRECADLCDRFQARDVGMQPAECAGAIRRMFGVKNGQE